MLGTGILKGLYVTAKNLAGSYHDPERLTTIQYPEETAHIPENYRNYPFLVFDGAEAVAGLRCTACKMCEKECPPQCIYIVGERDPATKKMRPKVFDLDISVCMGCGICVEVCPFESIKMDQHFEVAATERFEELLLHREQLAKPDSYYHKIHPTEAAVSDGVLAAEKRKAEERAAKAAAAAAAKAATPPVPPTTASGEPVSA
ncbi:MAG: 4Fe-4S dicluster domain-containing protein [Puniceicoccales bacterium]|jgi:NADH-quinone oxidoreductase subunit I|nr:4Fe-4S dicluster domain-containing protein [Puniceicoccales bacterium]